MKLRILTWNIHKGIGGVDRQYSLERVADVIRDAQPDVAVLQEVADGWPPADHEIQAERLCEMTELEHLAFAPEHRFKVGGYGNAILSRYPILDRFRLDLKIGWRKQRSALQARVLLPGEERRTCVITNLHLGLAETERRQQLRLLFESEQMMTQEEPAIIAGDLNDVFGGLERRFFAERGFCRAVERARSFPAYSPCFSLDGIFIRGLVKNHGTVVRTPKTRFASDHLPLLSEVEVSPT